MAFVALGMTLAPTSAFGQKTYGGVCSYPDGRPAYKTTNPAWSFEAEVAYSREGYVREVSHLVFLPGRAVQRSWADMRPVPKPINKQNPPGYVHFYDQQNGNIVFEARPLDYGKTFRPTRTSCLLALQQKIATVGQEAVRKKYGVPAKFPLSDIDGIRSERFIGEHSTSNTRPGTFGINFLVNEMPSGFGWPPFMFRLTVCTPDALRAADVPLKAVGKETVAGFVCTKYMNFDKRMQTTLWVEPKTKIALREETLVRPTQFPGDRMPPRKPFKVGYVITKFRLIKSAPRETFTLPPGVTVELPELLWNMPLPPGVKRKRMEGMEAKLGIPLRPYSSGAEVVRTPAPRRQP